MTNGKSMYESGTGNPDRGPGRRRVHEWTSAGKRPQKVSLCLTFRPALRGLAMSRLDSQVVSCKADQTDTWSSRGSRTPCGTPNPKVSYQSSLVIHCLRTKSPSRIG